MINSTERSDILVFNCYLCHVRYLLTCYVYSTKISEISDIAKCFENFVSQALGVLTRIYAAELREQLKSRILNNVRVQEGDSPSEEPKELMKEMDACLNTLFALIFKINKTNINTISEGRTITEMMAERDILSMRITSLREIFNKASESQERYSRSEIKMVTIIDIKPLSKKIDDLSKQLRELDMKIQTLNFTTELTIVR